MDTLLNISLLFHLHKNLLCYLIVSCSIYIKISCAIYLKIFFFYPWIFFVLGLLLILTKIKWTNVHNAVIVKNIYNTRIILVFHWSAWYLTIYPYIKSLSLSMEIAQGFRVICDYNFDWWFFWIPVFASAIAFLGKIIYADI